MAGANDIRAGGAFVEISATDEKLREGLERASGRLRHFGRELNHVGHSAEALSMIGEHAGRSSGAVGVLGAGIKGLSGSLGLIASGGALGAFVGLAVAAVAIGAAMSEMAEKAKEAVKETTKLREEGDKHRAASLAEVDRLVELSEKTELNNAEMGEADHIIRTLTETYGDLGVSLDTVTGKINGAGEAQRKLNDLLKEQAKAQLETEIHAQEKRLSQIKSAMTSNFHPVDFWGDVIDSVVGDGDAAEKRANEMRTEAQDLNKSLALRRERLKLMNETKPDPEHTAAAGNEAFKHSQAVREAGTQAADHLKHLDEEREKRNQTQLEQRIAEIQKETREREKAIQAVIASEKARPGGGRKEVLDKLNDRMDNLGKESIDEIQAERRKAHEKEIEERLKREEKYQDEIAKLEIETTKDGLEKKLALLQLEYDKAIEKAEVEGDSPELIDKLFGLKAKLAEQEDKSPLKAFGTFSSAGLSQIGGGSAEIPQKQLGALNAVNKNLKEVKRAVEKAAPVFQ